MEMTKEQVREIVKEMFSNGDITIYVTNEADTYYKGITTTVEVWLDGKCVAKESDNAYLGTDY